MKVAGIPFLKRLLFIHCRMPILVLKMFVKEKVRITPTNQQEQWLLGNGTSTITTVQKVLFKTQTMSLLTMGSFSSKLKITSDKSCSDSIVKTAIVHPLPTAAYSATNVCIPYPAVFTNVSSVSPGNINYQKWRFTNIDNDTSNSLNPTKIFATHGTYNVKLLVRSDSGCVDSISKPVLYFEKPVVDFTIEDMCANSTAFLINTSSVNTSTFANWKWDIDNNNTTDYSSKNMSHKYAQHGQKTIQLIGTTVQGCIDTMAKTMLVHPLPLADFSPTPNCVTDSLSFADGSSIASGSITNYNWNFNEGVGAASKNPKKKFSSEGNKQVRLIITSDKNCKDTVDKPVIVYPLPQPNFSTTPVCLKIKQYLTIQAISPLNILPIKSHNMYGSLVTDNRLLPLKHSICLARQENTKLL